MRATGNNNPSQTSAAHSNALGETVTEPAASGPVYAAGADSGSQWAVPIATAVTVADNQLWAPPPVVVIHHGNNATKCLHITQIVFGCITGLVSLLLFAPSTYAIVVGALGLVIGISATTAGFLYNPCGCCGHGPILTRQQVAIVSFVSGGLCFVDIIAGIVQYASFTAQQAGPNGGYNEMGIALQTVWLLMSGSVSAFAGMATWREQSDAARGPQGYAVSPQNAPTAVEMRQIPR